MTRTRLTSVTKEVTQSSADLSTVSWLGALLYHLPVAQDDDAVPEPQSLVEIVSNDDDRLPDLLLYVEQHGPHVGSDQRMSRMGASFVSAQARPTRCCMPLESSFGYFVSKPFRPTRSIQHMAELICWERGIP